jgi:hypothetical protein
VTTPLEWRPGVRRRGCDRARPALAAVWLLAVPGVVGALFLLATVLGGAGSGAT